MRAQRFRSVAFSVEAVKERKLSKSKIYKLFDVIRCRRRWVSSMMSWLGAVRKMSLKISLFPSDLDEAETKDKSET